MIRFVSWNTGVCSVGVEEEESIRPLFRCCVHSSLHSHSPLYAFAGFGKYSRFLFDCLECDGFRIIVFVGMTIFGSLGS